MSAAHVAIVGAGIVGASVAYHLALGGAHVQLFDAAAGPARGVTAPAFGWVNLVHGDPADGTAYRLRREAVVEYARLQRALPEAFDAARRGSFVWKRTAAATEALVERHRAAGATIEIVERDAIRAAEPHLRDVPDIAAWSPDDLAVGPVRIAEALIDAAVEAGAQTHWGQDVLGLETSGGRVTGIRTADRVMAADVVVVASGTGTRALLAPLGVDLGLEVSPALLLRYVTDRPFINHIVNAPDLEIRHAGANALWVADACDGDASRKSPDTIGRTLLDVVQRRFDAATTVAFDAAHVGMRPKFADGLPRVGFLPGVGGLYVAVGHPGVILAPLLGRVARKEIIGGERSALLVPLAKAMGAMG